jgi:hypothetical protein
VTDTLELALAASGCDTAKVVHQPRLLSDNGASNVAGDLARWLGDKGIAHIRGAPNHPQTQGHDRALAPDPEEQGPAGKLLPSRPGVESPKGDRCELRRRKPTAAPAALQGFERSLSKMVSAGAGLHPKDGRADAPEASARH